MESGEDFDMEMDTDIDTFEITKFDYGKIFKNYADQNVNYREILHKIFESWEQIGLRYMWGHTIKVIQMSGRNNLSSLCHAVYRIWIQGYDGKLLDPDTLHIACLSNATDNKKLELFQI